MWRNNISRINHKFLAKNAYFQFRSQSYTTHLCYNYETFFVYYPATNVVYWHWVYPLPFHLIRLAPVSLKWLYNFIWIDINMLQKYLFDWYLNSVWQRNGKFLVCCYGAEKRQNRILCLENLDKNFKGIPQASASLKIPFYIV